MVNSYMCKKSVPWQTIQTNSEIVNDEFKKRKKNNQTTPTNTR